MMSGRRSAGAWLGIGVAVLAVTSACTLPGHRLETNPADLAPKLAQSTFIEEGKLVALVVSTRPMRFRLDRPYIPIEIAVVDKGLEKLSLTRESFTLVDASGARYAAVGRDELTRDYGNTDIDRELAEALPFVRTRFPTYRRVVSNFTPGFDAPIVRDHVFLSKFTYLYDMIYFPRPEGDLVHQPLELLVSAPELPDPLVIRFQLQDGKK
jgi:hypothetical protein